MLFLHLNQHTATNEQAVKELLDKSKHDSDFYVLLIGATLLAIGAIFTDSVPLLIASMIIAPLAYPILALSLGIISARNELVVRSVLLLLVSCSTTLLIAAVVTLIFGDGGVADRYVSFDGNLFVAAVVAIVSGGIAAYGMIRPKIASAITGVAIAVSLLPPLTATGVNFAAGNAGPGRQAFALFMVNVIGIFAGSAWVFWRSGLHKVYQNLQKT